MPESEMAPSSISDLSLQKALERIDFNSCAEQSNWSMRSGCKITPAMWCMAFCLGSSCQNASLRVSAFFLGLKSALTISKQAIHQRLRNNGDKMIEAVLSRAVSMKIGKCRASLLERFPRVIIQDSTCLKLPKRLEGAFPGSANQCGSTAVMRIQAYYEMKANRFMAMEMASFRDNDQAASGQALDVAAKGDLLIRDLGYFCLKALRQLMETGVELLTRHKLNVHLFEAKDGTEIDLLKRLKSNGNLDIEVLVGKEQKLPMRLVAYPVPDSVANERRRRMRNNRDRRKSPSKRAMALQGWQIFLTTASEQDLPAKSIGDIYSFRWQIETLFKSWKSSFRIGEFTEYVSEEMARALVWAALLRITLFQALIMNTIRSLSGVHKVSVLKLASLIGCTQLGIDLANIDEKVWFENLRKHSLYDKRSRENLMEKWLNFGEAGMAA